MKIFAILLAFCVCGCYTDHQVQVENHAQLATGGEIVGTLPDGRELRRVWVTTNTKWHAVYFIGNSVTSNHEEHAGKNQTSTHTEAFVD